MSHNFQDDETQQFIYKNYNTIIWQEIVERWVLLGLVDVLSADGDITSWCFWLLLFNGILMKRVISSLT